MISFLMMIASSENSGAQSNHTAPFVTLDSSINSKPHSLRKIKAKKRVVSVNARVLKNFARSNKIISEVKATQVNIKAVRDFTKTHKSISGVKWYTTEGGFLANFDSKGTDTRIVYDQKGKWLYNLLSYPEACLAFEIRDMVKRKYYDDDILFIHEYVFENRMTIYLIRIVDQQSTIKTLKVCDGEIVGITNRD